MYSVNKSFTTSVDHFILNYKLSKTGVPSCGDVKNAVKNTELMLDMKIKLCTELKDVYLLLTSLNLIVQL